MSSIIGNRTTCDIEGCSKEAKKYHWIGDKGFSEKFNRTHYSKLSSGLQMMVRIIGFCKDHSSDKTGE